MNLRTALQLECYRSLLRPRLFASYGGDPEAVHEELIASLARLGRSGWQRSLLRALIGTPASPTTVAGVRFPGRVGLAAGMDKDGLAAQAWASLGFAFAELGTVTAIPQPGNDRPRVFRLRDSQALVNRMGFNNRGAAALATRLEGLGVRRGAQTLGIPLGISLGKSKVVPVAESVADYLTGLHLLAPYADYIAINVSSPNTPDLRSLQGAEPLATLLSALTRAAAQIPHELGAVPVFVKIAPDLTDAQIDEAVAVVTDNGGSGIIATNTTLARDHLAVTDRAPGREAGGLSGAPLTRRAREVVARVASATTLPVVASGGIMTPADARAMFDLGAQLVQVYTGFIYAGSALPTGINAIRPTSKEIR